MDPYILLANGKQYWFESPDRASLDVPTIAGALSRLCRFSGHTRRFYSVAEHSIAVALLVPPEDRREALMHDAAEAFLVDVPSPLKPLLRDYAALEEKAHIAVAERFGLRFPWPASVKQADLVMLATEKRDLMPRDDLPWGVIAKIAPLEQRIVDHDTWRSSAYWEMRFREMWAEIGGEP